RAQTQCGSTARAGRKIRRVSRVTSMTHPGLGLEQNRRAYLGWYMAYAARIPDRKLLRAVPMRGTSVTKWVGDGGAATRRKITGLRHRPARNGTVRFRHRGETP